MGYLLKIPRRYHPLARIVIGVVLVVLGIALLGKIVLVVGGALVLWGLASGYSRLRNRADDDDRDKHAGQ